MKQSTKVFLREELYERVWTTPVHRLAKEFEYSDVGLAKLCRKHQIPTPGVGYWRRVEMGHKPARTPLPQIERPNPYRIELVIRELGLSESDRVPQDVPTVTVSPDRPISHPLVVRSERLLRVGRKDEKELLCPRKGSVSHIKVTGAVLPRALCILDALFHVLDERGIQILWPKEENANLNIVTESETIGLCLSEILETRTHTPTEQEAARRKREPWWSPPKWDYRPSGMLRITLLCDESTSARRNWSDGKKRRVEDYLGEVVLGIGTLVESIKKLKTERQRWREECEAKQRRREEEQTKHEEFLRKAEVIRKAAQALHESQLVRSLVVCLGNSRHLQELDTESLGRMRGLLEWCSEYANRIDPTCHPEVLVRDFEKTT